MKRYVIFNHPIARIGFEQRESDDGEWVKYPDAIEAIKAEREACAMECEKISADYAGVKWSLAKTAAEAIRARVNNYVMVQNRSEEK